MIRIHMGIIMCRRVAMCIGIVVANDIDIDADIANAIDELACHCRRY